MYHYSDILSNHLVMSLNLSIHRITGIFTVGKGKDYFLRNLSRLIFVIVITSVIAIPIFKTIYNDNLTQRHWTLDMILFGGRDVWYLYGVLLASVFLPLVKIDHPISKYKLAFFFAGILLSATAMLPYRQTFLAPLQLFCMGVASYIFHKLIFSLQLKMRWIYVLVLFILMSTFEIVLYIVTGANIFPFVSMMLLIILFLHFNVPTPPFLNFIVRKSYYIYEIHYVVNILVALIFVNKDDWNINGVFALKSLGNAWIYTAIVFAISFAFSVPLSTLHLSVWEVLANKTLYKIKVFSWVYWLVLVIWMAIWLTWICITYYNF